MIAAKRLQRRRKLNRSVRGFWKDQTPNQTRGRLQNLRSDRRRLRLESLEDRRLLAGLVVQNGLDGSLASLANDSELSLREAIEIANNPGTTIDGFSSGDVADTITFEPLAFTGGAANQINLSGIELEVTQTLNIDATALAEPITIDAQENSRVLHFSSVSGNLSLTDTTLTGGKTTGQYNGGGGIRFASDGTLSLTRSTVSENMTSGNYSDGGGIYTLSGNVTLTNSTVSGNSTGDNSYGGGIRTDSGNVTLTNSTISGNQANGYLAAGGGIFASSGDVTLTGSTINGNGSEGNGGGVYSPTGDLTITRSTISGNHAKGVDGSGGGLWFDDATVLIESSTVTGNTAVARGGGLSVVADEDDAVLTIRNSIIAGNTDGGDLAPDLESPDSPETNLIVFNSLIGDTEGNDITAAGGNLVNVDWTTVLKTVLEGDDTVPDLANNGGPTLTVALLPNSPAIDAGGATSLMADQRGLLRVVDGNNDTNPVTDIGAVEFQTDGYDFGDAPSRYAIANHRAIGPQLGENRDTEIGQQPSALADGDGSDEDGVLFGGITPGGNQAALNVDLQNVSDAMIDAWIDFNRDGDWNDTGEQVLSSSPVSSGLQTINFALPSAGVTAGESFARVRVSTTGGLSPDGVAADGEVEDYQITIGPSWVESVVINGGDPQRSSLDSIRVTFDREVTLDNSGGNVFQIANVATGEVVTEIVATPLLIGGKTVVDLTFDPTGLSTTSFGSLTGGSYQLAIDSTYVTSLGVSMAGNHFFGGTANPADEFFRKFGDITGDNQVGLSDFASFRGTFGLELGDAGYLDGFDADGSNQIGLGDFAAFRGSFGT